MNDFRQGRHRERRLCGFLVRFDNMGGKLCDPKGAECFVVVASEWYLPEACAVLLTRAGEDCLASVVADNEMMFVEQNGAIVVTQFS